MDLNLTPLKTSFLAVVQVLAFKVGENDNRATFHIFVNFLKTFSSLCLVFIHQKTDDPVISQTFTGI